jgi:anti-sigma factor RsiW
MSHEQCDRVPEYFDGELSAGDAAAMERHLQGCAECAARLDELQRLREGMRAQLTYHRAHVGVRSGLRQALDKHTAHSPRSISRASRPFWWGAVSGGLAAAAVFGVAFLLSVNAGADRIVGDLTSAHLRSLLPNRLLDVVSTDRHTVKPWFAGHADVSPPTMDFSSAGYSLIGGRVDYVGSRRAAVLVYRHGAHIANVFVWADDGVSLPALTTDKGYHTACWHGEGDLAFCAVSDMALNEFASLERLLRE